MSYVRPSRAGINLVIAIRRELETFNLKPVKKIIVKFDPFHGSVRSARDFLFQATSKKTQLSNPKCRVVTEIVNDRSEPTVQCDLSNGEKVIFKTAQLTTLELLQSYKAYVAVHEEAPNDDSASHSTTILKKSVSK